MPLNISIDVDGTLLDEYENVHPEVRNQLGALKNEGHRLQLWSTGGADYARRRATEKVMTDLFESYATKPDIAIDDLPESARPVATIKVGNDFPINQALELLKSKVEPCVETVLCPSPSLIRLVADLQNTADNARATLGNLLHPNVPVHPVPFFGNLESARVISIGLNPAITEFSPHRSWNETLDANDLTFRLVNYFRLAGINYPPPHPWFSEITEFLHILKCPQKIAAAHVDLCPWTSIAPIGLTAEQRRRFWTLVDEQMETWLARTLTHARQTAKLIIVLESPYPTGFEIERQKRIVNIIRESFVGWDGTIEIQNKENLPDWAWQNRQDLRQLIGFSNIID